MCNGRDDAKAGTDVGKKQESDLIYLYLTSVVESVHKVVASQAARIKTGMQNQPLRMLCASSNISLIFSFCFLGQR